MRKLLISLLLATAVSTPALAQDRNWQDRAAARQDRQNARQGDRGDRQQNRGDDHSNRDRPSAPNYQPPQRTVAPRPDRNFTARPARNFTARPARNFAPQPDRNVTARPDRNFTPRPDRNFTPQYNAERPRPDAYDQRSRDSVTNWRERQRDQVRQDDRQGYRAPTRVTAPNYAQPDRSYRYDRTRNPQWNSNWRNDRRYDWRRYRDQHRSTFRLGAYYDPFGWGYRRYGIGWNLSPAYYGQNYWLTNPYMYDLPMAPYPLQWVRYYNDALLVNVFTGQVVDVMYDFFW